MHHHLGEWPINLALFLVFSNEAAHISIGARPLSLSLPSRQSRAPNSLPAIGGPSRGGIHVTRAFCTRAKTITRLSLGLITLFGRIIPSYDRRFPCSPGIVLSRFVLRPGLITGAQECPSLADDSSFLSGSVSVCLLVCLLRILSPSFGW